MSQPIPNYNTIMPVGVTSSLYPPNPLHEDLGPVELVEQLNAWNFLNISHRRELSKEMRSYLSNLNSGEGTPEMLAIWAKAKGYEQDLNQRYRTHFGREALPSWYWDVSLRMTRYITALLLIKGYDMNRGKYFNRETFTYTLSATQQLPSV